MPAMNLASIKKTGDIKRPMKIVLYGTEGVGKTTFAADAPGAVFLPVEDGSGRLDLDAFPRPETWQDALNAIATLRTEKHEFKTFVVDTLDRLERLCWSHVCDKGGKKSIEDFGYGKGYVLALEHWAGLINRLDELSSERGLNVVLLAHAHLKTKRNPAGLDYDRYTLKMHDKASQLFKEWPDFLLFADHEVFVEEKKNRAKAFSAGHRIIHTAHTAAADAKNRAGLPPVIPLDWGTFYQEATSASPERLARMADEAAKLAASLPGTDKTTAQAYLKTILGKEAKLAQFIDRCRSKIALAEPETEETTKEGN